MDTERLYREASELDHSGNHGAAVKLYKQLAVDSDDPRHFIAYGVCLQRLGHWTESVKQLEHGITLKPHYCEGDARLFLAESLLKAGRKKDAITQWKLVADMEPEYPSYEAVPNEAKKRLAQIGA